MGTWIAPLKQRGEMKSGMLTLLLILVCGLGVSSALPHPDTSANVKMQLPSLQTEPVVPFRSSEPMERLECPGRFGFLPIPRVLEEFGNGTYCSDWFFECFEGIAVLQQCEYGRFDPVQGQCQFDQSIQPCDIPMSDCVQKNVDCRSDHFDCTDAGAIYRKTGAITSGKRRFLADDRHQGSPPRVAPPDVMDAV